MNFKDKLQIDHEESVDEIETRIEESEEEKRREERREKRAATKYGSRLNDDDQ